MNKILIVAAHPDDDILGSGGTVARLIKEGAKGYTLILGEGPTSRGILTNEDLNQVWHRVKDANKIIGINPVHLIGYVDNRFDTLPLLDIVKTVESYIESIQPNIIFTHFRNDLNIDHRITYQAVITATRPTKDCPVKEIYSFEIPSSTEWNFPNSFSPNIFFDITDTIDQKEQALKYYEAELRPYPHPRSVEGIEALASWRGRQVGYEYAEAFEAVRILR